MKGLPLLTNILLQLDALLAAAVVIVAFSLLAYIALQNWHTSIARALCVLLAGIVIVYGGDVLLSQAERDSTIQFLLRAQWLGIVCVPAGYIHLSDALLTYSGVRDRRRRWLVWLGYLVSVGFFALAVTGDLLLRDGIKRRPLAQFGAGPLFWLFALYFGLVCLGGLLTVLRVRGAALTPTLRRRLTYLGATFLGPAMAVFPYLLIAGAYTVISSDLILLVSVLGNASVAAMIIVMVYSIAFQGLLLPDRLIKQDFIRWGLYGPFVGITIVLFLRAVPPLARWTDLPQATLLTFGVMIFTVLMPLFVSKVKPYLDALVYMQDHAEIDYLRTLPRNTFTHADLRSLLENTLVVVCGALRVDTGFVAAPDEQGHYTIKSLVGARRHVKRFVAEHPLAEVLPPLESAPPLAPGEAPPIEAFLRRDGFCLLPLRGPEGDFLGALGVAYPNEALNTNSRRLIGALAHQMELALATVQMQQRLFDTLRGMGPEMQSLQTLNTRLEQATPASLESLEAEVALLPEFPQFVKDALTHYWGGPKLSDSPLLGLRTVRRLLDDQGGSPTRALQAVLRKAIENLRPDEQLDPSAQEWLLYNILQLRFLQGKRVRDIAERLAMSESDLYRKQRIAVEEVARQLALMEEAEPH
ncbi:MAG TPA: histidine kinase N-terminal 7TM domain-containing protein [Roseiflexaceae bacterium]|nr:histidine kinase N-terminal 7TM domain-containing protein [Roseiflexaceae bacterium]